MSGWNTLARLIQCFVTIAGTSQDLHNDAFTQSGFAAWNMCSGSDPRNNAFLKHKNSEGHRLDVERHHAYKNMRAAGKTVVHMIDSEHKKQVVFLLIYHNNFYCSTDVILHSI